MVISINRFSSKKLRDTSFTLAEGDPFYTHPCQSWATKVWVYTPDSISSFTDISPMDPIVAIAYVFMMQQQIIIGMDRYNDPTIQQIYKVSLSIFSVEADVAKQSIEQMQVFCDAVQSQFKKGEHYSISTSASTKAVTKFDQSKSKSLVN